MIENIPSGNYTIKISYIGFKTEIRVDVWIRPNAFSLSTTTLVRFGPIWSRKTL